MKVSIGKRPEEFIEKALENGRYASAREVVREGLRLVEEREAKLVELRRTIDDAIGRDGEMSDLELGAKIRARVARDGTAR